MGGKQSTNAPRVRTFSSSGEQVNANRSQGAEIAMGSSVSSTSGTRTRARSLGNFHTGPHSSSLSIPTSNGGPHVAGSPDSDSSTPEDGGPVMFGRPFTNSLPVHLIALQGIKCPVCAKFVPPEDIECHLVICLTKPRISYNEDVLMENKGECVICLDDLQQGDTIARLPCLCIYHKGCIDRWFEVNRSCPEHPGD